MFCIFCRYFCLTLSVFDFTDVTTVVYTHPSPQQLPISGCQPSYPVYQPVPLHTQNLPNAPAPPPSYLEASEILHLHTHTHKHISASNSQNCSTQNCLWSFQPILLSTVTTQGHRCSPTPASLLDIQMCTHSRPTTLRFAQA